MTDYNGPERREYCSMHKEMESIAKRSLPRWAFVSSLGGIMTVAVLFMSINESRMTDIKEALARNADQTEKAISRIEAGVERRINAQQELYRQEARRFYDLAAKNGEKLDRLSGQQVEIKSLQNLVLKKIKIAE